LKETEVKETKNFRGKRQAKGRCVKVERRVNVMVNRKPKKERKGGGLCLGGKIAPKIDLGGKEGFLAVITSLNQNHRFDGKGIPQNRH